MGVWFATGFAPTHDFVIGCQGGGQTVRSNPPNGQTRPDTS